MKNEEVIKVISVSHGGFIMEIHNVIEVNYEGKQAINFNAAKNCSIHKI